MCKKRILCGKSFASLPERLWKIGKWHCEHKRYRAPRKITQSLIGKCVKFKTSFHCGVIGWPVRKMLGLNDLAKYWLTTLQTVSQTQCINKSRQWKALLHCVVEIGKQFTGSISIFGSSWHLRNWLGSYRLRCWRDRDLIALAVVQKSRAASAESEVGGSQSERRLDFQI